MNFEPPEGSGSWGGTPPFGSATLYQPFRSFRDDLAAIGLFLDSAGDDTYPEGAPAGNGRDWKTDRGDISHGRGLDR